MKFLQLYKIKENIAEMLISSILSPITNISGFPDTVLQLTQFSVKEPPLKQTPNLSNVISCIICSCYLIVCESITQLFRIEMVDF